MLLSLTLTEFADELLIIGAKLHKAAFSSVSRSKYQLHQDRIGVNSTFLETMSVVELLPK